MKSSSILLAIAIAVPVVLSAKPKERQREQGAFLEQMQPRDSILIADQMRYGIRINGLEEGTKVALPDFKPENFGDGRVVLLTSWMADTVKVNKSRGGAPATVDVEYSLLTTSFDEGFYELPALAVALEYPDGKTDTLTFEPKFMDVRTMPVDTATFVPHDIKGQVLYPLTFAEVWPWVLGALAFAALVFFLVRFLISRRRRMTDAARKEPAHIVALRKLDRYRGEKHWAEDKQKGFYSGVTDALREYIASRYEVGAMEMTTKEIFDGLKSKEMEPELFNEMKELFERADFVKFAKYVASKEENAQVVPLAVRFVTQTYQQQLDEEEAQQSKE